MFLGGSHGFCIWVETRARYWKETPESDRAKGHVIVKVSLGLALALEALRWAPPVLIPSRWTRTFPDVIPHSGRAIPQSQSWQTLQSTTPARTEDMRGSQPNETVLIRDLQPQGTQLRQTRFNRNWAMHSHLNNTKPQFSPSIKCVCQQRLVLWPAYEFCIHCCNWRTFIALTESLDEVPEEFIEEDDIGILPTGETIAFVRWTTNSKIITTKSGQ